jgi:hypothetical protein
MYHLCFLTCHANQTYSCVVGQPTHPTNTTQTGSLAVRLQYNPDFLLTHLSSIINRVKGVSKRLLTVWATVSLAAFTSFTVFMSLIMIAQ